MMGSFGKDSKKNKKLMKLQKGYLLRESGKGIAFSTSIQHLNKWINTHTHTHTHTYKETVYPKYYFSKLST